VKKTLILLVAVGLSTGAMAQEVGTATKQAAKSTVEKTEQLGDEAKASMESQPKKTLDKAKAQVHKAKAKAHSQAAKDAMKKSPDSGSPQ
jgi:hypothetical protein